MSKIDILRKARETVKKKGIIAGKYIDPETNQCCIIGHLALAAGVTPKQLQACNFSIPIFRYAHLGSPMIKDIMICPEDNPNYPRWKPVIDALNAAGFSPEELQDLQDVNDDYETAGPVLERIEAILLKERNLYDHES